MVYFTCDEEALSLSDPYPLKCQLNATGSGLEWNGTVPSCIGIYNDCHSLASFCCFLIMVVVMFPGSLYKVNSCGIFSVVVLFFSTILISNAMLLRQQFRRCCVFPFRHIPALSSQRGSVLFTATGGQSLIVKSVTSMSFFTLASNGSPKEIIFDVEF